MGFPFPFVTAYERMVRDASRHELPGGACWDLIDVLPDMDAPARARAPWTEFASAGSPHAPIGVGWCNFAGSPGNLVVVSTGEAFKLGASGASIGVGTVGNVGTANPIPRMVSLNDKLFFPISGGGGTPGLYYFDGTHNVALVTGGPKAPLDVAVFGDFVVAIQGNKVYFSNAGDGTKWNLPVVQVLEKQSTLTSCTLTCANSFAVGDSITVDLNDPNFDGTFVVSAVTAGTVTYLNNTNPVGITATTGTVTDNSPNSYIQMQDECVAIAALRGVLIVFCEGSIWRIRGTVPPGNGPSNMAVDFLGPNTEGVIDARSIAYYASTCLFANDQGVWETDGVSLKSLTEKFGIGQYWRQLTKDLGAQYAVAWQHRGYYFITLWSGPPATSSPIDTLCCDIDRGSWFRMSNMNFFGGACNSVLKGQDDVALAYSGAGGIASLGSISSIFAVDAGGNQDPNGVVITPTIETPYLRGFLHFHRKWIPSPGLQTWRHVYLSYDLTGGGGLKVEYSTNPDAIEGAVVGYVSPPDWPEGNILPSTTGRQRVRIPMQITAQGIALRLSVVPSGAAPWTSFRMWEVEVEFYPRETSRV